MTRGVGIELTGSRCTLVEVHPAKRSAGPRVGAFRSIAYSPDSSVGLVAALRQLLGAKVFSRRARVVVWGLRSVHQFLSLPPAKGDDLRALAEREARRLTPALSEWEYSSGIVPIGPGDLKQDVLFAAASVADVRARLQPLASAGFEVEAVLTPAMALAALAVHRDPLTPGAVAAYVSVNRDAYCLAIVRDGVLLFARETPGSTDGAGAGDRAAFASRLTAEMKRTFLFARQSAKVEVQQVFLCGDYPDLRALTGPMMQALDVHVETLDSLDGVDAGALPEPASEFRDHMGEMRLALGVAGEAAPPINLLPAETRSRRETRRFGWQLAAAALAGFLVLGALYGAAYAAHTVTAGRAGALRDQAGVLEPQVRRAEAARQEGLRTSARQHALDAFAVQGPRMARVLEAIGRNTPQAVVLESLAARTRGAGWNMVLGGLATGSSPGSAQGTFNQFLQQVATSPYVGNTRFPPTMRVSSNGRLPARPGAEARSGEAAERPYTSGWVLQDYPDSEDRERVQRVVDHAADEYAAREREAADRLRRRSSAQLDPWTIGWILNGDPIYGDGRDWERTSGGTSRGSGRPAPPRLVEPAVPVTTPPPAPAFVNLLEFTATFEVRK